MTQSRRDFLKEAGITAGFYIGVSSAFIGVFEGINMAVGYGFDATDDYEGHTTIEKLNNNMGKMNGAEITVEGHPAFLEARKNLLDIEPVDWDNQLDDWDISDDDGWFNAEVMDDDDIIYDAEEVYKLHENPDGGSSIIVYDESNDIENALGERPERGEPADQRVAIYGTVKRGKRGYTVEIDQAETV